MGCVYSRTCIGDTCIPKDGGRVSNKAIKAGGGATRSVAELSTASSDEGIESRDQFGQLNYNRDSEVGITRLSRVSSQFLPPDGSKTISIPNGNYELRYSFLSQRGYYPDALDKANQDSFCIHSPFGTSPNDHFFGVFDGHGEFGAQCSQFVKRKLCENLLRNSKFHVDAVEACHASFLTTNLQLHADILDDSMSGTTAITVLVRGKKIYIANSGDSRAVIAERRDKELVAVDLSMDQTPFRTDELERVKLCGARVLTLDQIEGLKNPDVQCWGTEEDDDGDPPRLWVPNGMYPGTAFTRSLGDSIAETIGVVATPEIISLELTQEQPFFVLASDGVFEFLSSQNVVDMVAKYKDPRDACAAIVAESYRLWLQFETRTDDITIIVVHINGLTETNDGQSRNSAAVFQSTAPQVVEVTGAESPSPLSWNPLNHRVRHDVSKARLRAIESSLENGHVWLPHSPSHRKTWEEEAHLEQALHDHFLFRKLTDSQSHVLLDCMQRIDVQPGEIVVEQGGEGDCFYVVGSGEFEVLAMQGGKDGEAPRVLQTYTAEKLSSFGELALMYNKPLQASVRALTNGTLWALRREDFRGILMSEFSNLSSLKLLRSVDILSRLTILQLSHIADLLSEVTFSDGQVIVNENVGILALYIINKGQVRITVDTDIMKIQKFSSLYDDQKQEQDLQSSKEIVLQKTEGSYFGEWVLLGEEINAFSAVAVGDVVCSVLTQAKFESVVGPLSRFPHRDQKSRDYSLEIHKETVPDVDPSRLSELQLSNLEWKTCLYSTDYCEIGLVSLKDSENFLSLKRFSKKRIKKLGKEEQVLKERNLMKSVNPRSGVPQVLRTCADQAYAGILLNTCLACPFISILHTPLDEASAQFCAASVVASLEELHKNGILYRGISPDVLMFDQTGHLQLVDFRFGKQLNGERTFTICGMADSLAPEIVQGKGHGLSVDWWALGVLIYFMLQGEMPFGSWRQSEIDAYAKIAKGQLTLPETFSPEVVDLITKLLEVDETSRLGCDGPEAVKSHPWFHRIDWQGIADGSFPVPVEIMSRINQHSEDCAIAPASPSSDVEELDDTSEWLEDW